MTKQQFLDSLRQRFTEDGGPSLMALAEHVAEAFCDVGPDVTDLNDMTKAELMDLAQDIDLEGRSQMTKDELIEALS